MDDHEFDKWLKAGLSRWPYLIELRLTPMTAADPNEPETFTIVLKGEGQCINSEQARMHAVYWDDDPLIEMKDED